MEAHRKYMGKSSLVIVERSFRGAVERQDFHAVWMSCVVDNLGRRTALLLKGNSVLYALNDQVRPEVAIGGVRLDTLPYYKETIRDLLNARVPVFVTENDCRDRRIDLDRLIEGVRPVSAVKLAEICGQYDHIWFW